VIRSQRIRLGVVAVAAAVGLGVVAVSSLGGSLVYYKTPTEVASQKASTHRLRVGGLVQVGSVHRVATDVRFVLTDGATDMTVVYHGQPPGVFQEGQGAVVEGTFGADGLFRSDFLVVKHSNEYKRSDGSVYHPPTGSASAAAAR
jgi:cytochrome c-type biogenesis protein CcmE